MPLIRRRVALAWEWPCTETTNWPRGHTPVIVCPSGSELLALCPRGSKILPFGERAHFPIISSLSRVSRPRANYQLRRVEADPSPFPYKITNFRNKLTSLRDAWNLPIPSELRQRQDEFLKVGGGHLCSSPFPFKVSWSTFSPSFFTQIRVSRLYRGEYSSFFPRMAGRPLDPLAPWLPLFTNIPRLTSGSMSCFIFPPPIPPFGLVRLVNKTGFCPPPPFPTSPFFVLRGLSFSFEFGPGLISPSKSLPCLVFFSNKLKEHESNREETRVFLRRPAYFVTSQIGATRVIRCN